MADRFGKTHAGSSADTTAIPPYNQLDAGKVSAKLRHIREVFDLAAMATASQTPAAGDRLYLGRLPIGAYTESIVMTASQSMGTSTIAIGNAAAPGKYRAAATMTAVDTPTVAAPASMKAQDALKTPEDVWATIAAAALPATGTLVVEIRYLVVA